MFFSSHDYRQMQRLDERRFKSYCTHLRDMYNFDPTEVDNILQEMKVLAANSQNVPPLERDNCAVVAAEKKETENTGKAHEESGDVHVGGGNSGHTTCSTTKAGIVTAGANENRQVSVV